MICDGSSFHSFGFALVRGYLIDFVATSAARLKYWRAFSCAISSSLSGDAVSFR
jgi:hypothetical protein